MRILLVVYDNDGHISWFPQGLSYIAAVLLKHGYDVEIYNQDWHHSPDSHLTEYLNANYFDVVGVSVIGGYYQYKKLNSLSCAINESEQRPFYIIGGHGPVPDPEFFLKKTRADVVVMGEGEVTIVELLEVIGSKKSLNHVNGIAFRHDDNVTINDPRPLIKDIDTIPFPAYELFPIEYHRLIRIIPYLKSSELVMPVLTGRGCKFQCNFCYRMDKGLRIRKNEAIIEEIKFLKERYNITGFLFSDELLMTSENRTISLCEDFIKNKLNIRWFCNGRLNYATPEVLKIMKKSGCVFINYGIESVDDYVLERMNKKLTFEQIIKGVEATLATGISPGLNIIFGHIGDTKKTIEKSVDFLIKYDDGAQMRTIRPVTPYPGSPLFNYAIEQGLLKDTEDFYENKHTNSDLLSVNFTNMSDDEFYQCLYSANERLLVNYFTNKKKKFGQELKDLYLNRNAEFRGFRQT